MPTAHAALVGDVMGIFSELYDDVKEDVAEEVKKGVSELAGYVAGELGIDADAIEDCLVDFDCGDLVNELGETLLELKDEYLTELVVWTIEFGSEQVVDLLIELGVPPSIANTLGRLLEDVAADAAGGALEALGLANAAAAIEASSLGQGSNPVGEASSGLFHSYGPGTELWRSSRRVRWEGNNDTALEFYKDVGWTSGLIPLLDSTSEIAANSLPNPVAQAFQPAYQKTVGAMAVMDTLAYALTQYLKGSDAAGGDLNIDEIYPPLMAGSVPLNWQDTPELSRYELQVAQLVVDRLSAIISAAFGSVTPFDWEKTSVNAGEIDGVWFQPVVMVPRYSNYIGPGYPPRPETNQDNPPGIYDSVYMACTQAIQIASEELPAGLDTLESLFQWIDDGLAMLPEDHPDKRPNIYPTWVQVQTLINAIPEVVDIMAEAQKLKYDRATSEKIQSQWEAAREAAISATVASAAAGGGPVAIGPLSVVGPVIASALPPEADAEINERTSRAQSGAQREFVNQPRGRKVLAVRRAARRVANDEPPPRPRQSSTALPTAGPTPETAPAGTASAAVPIAAGAGALFLLARLLA